MNMSKHEFEVIKDMHNRCVRLSHTSITQLIREVEIAKEDVRGIELKIDKTYEEKGKLRETLKFYADKENYLDTLIESATDFAPEHYEPAEIFHDYGEKARKALEETK